MNSFIRRAAIDIGTNTTRLLVADYDGANTFTPVFRREMITRLGGGFTEAGGIADDAMERTVAVLQEFKNTMDDLKVESLVAVATSVVREACNGKKFINRVKDSAGIDITVITGEIEAKLATRGALLPIQSPFDHVLIFDIGGGSTEFIFTNGTNPLFIESTDLGVIHLTETILHDDPPTVDQIAAVRQAVRNRLTQLRSRFEGQELFPFSPDDRVILIGIAGTPTTIAAIDLEMKEYDRDRITNHKLTSPHIEKIFQRLIQLPNAQRLNIPGLQKGREDLIIPGIIITQEVMDVFNLAPLRIIDSGILEGILLEK